MQGKVVNFHALFVEQCRGRLSLFGMHCCTEKGLALLGAWKVFRALSFFGAKCFGGVVLFRLPILVDFSCGLCVAV